MDETYILKVNIAILLLTDNFKVEFKIVYRFKITTLFEKLYKRKNPSYKTQLNNTQLKQIILFLK